MSFHRDTAAITIAFLGMTLSSQKVNIARLPWKHFPRRPASSRDLIKCKYRSGGLCREKAKEKRDKEAQKGKMEKGEQERALMMLSHMWYQLEILF